MWEGVARNSVVGISTGYRLNGPRVESRWGEGRGRFSSLLQTGFGTHTTSSFQRGATLTTQTLPAPSSEKG
jgi:hypothetical protein